MSVGDERDGFGVGESGAFAIAVPRAFAPRVKRVEALFGFTYSAQVLPVHVEAVGASVDLRSAQLDQVQQGRFESGVMKELLQLQHGVIGAGCKMCEIEAHTNILVASRLTDSYQPVSVRERRAALVS